LTRFAYSRPGVDGVDVAVLGVLEFALVNREEKDGRIRVIHTFKATLVSQALPGGGTVGVAEVDLPSTGPTQGLRVVEKLQPLRGSREYTVAVPSPAPDVATDLIEVDPATLVASDATVPAWQAITDTIAGHLNQSTTAAADASAARVAAGEFAQAAALSAADADTAAGTADTAASNAGGSAAAALAHANDAALSASQAAGSADVAADAASAAAGSASTAAAQLGLGLLKASNLADVPDKAAARIALNVASATESRAANAKTARRALRGINVAGAEFTSAGTMLFDTAASYRFLAGRGHTLVRIPFLWESIQPTLSAPLDGAQLAALKGAVKNAEAAGLAVILDVHNYGAYNGVAYGAAGSFTLGDFTDLWTRLSTEFKGNPAVVGYGLMNEPRNLPTVGGVTGNDRWKLAQQAALDAIRANGDVTCVLISGYTSASMGSWLNASNGQPTPYITDPANNFRWEAHHYWDAGTTGAYTGTYAQAVAAGFGSSQGDAARTAMYFFLDQWITWLKDNNQRGYIGEFGWPSSQNGDTPADSAAWNSLAEMYLSRIDQESGDLVWFTAWATGDRWTDGYNLQFYESTAGTLSTPLSNAATLEAHLPSRLTTPAALSATYETQSHASTTYETYAAEATFPITRYGAVPGEFLTDAAMTAGSALLSTAHVFTSADIGKAIGVKGAGPVSTDYSTLANDGVLVTTIASVASGVATLANTAVTTTSGARAVFGTPIDSALDAANAAAVAAGGGVVFVPAGVWVGVRQVVFSSGVGLTGAGKTRSRLYYIHADDGSDYNVTPWLYWNTFDSVDGLRHDVNVSNVLIDGAFFVGTAGYSFRAKLILIDRTLDSAIRNCSILNSPATAVGYDVSQRCIIEGNTILNAGRFAIVNSNRGNSSGSGIGVAVPADAGGVDATIVIRDNFISGNWTIGGQPGLGSTGRSGINIEGIYSSGLPGGSVVTDIAHRGSHLVTGNVVWGFYAGIRDSGALATRILGNDVRKCQIGILCGSKGSGTDSRIPLGTLIQGNVVREGVVLNLSTGATATASGIEVNTTANIANPATSGRIRIGGNDISTIPGPGVLISGNPVSVDVVSIENNTIRACGGYGIRIVGVVNQLSLTQNTIDGNNTQGLGANGISIHGSTVWTGGQIAGNIMCDLAGTATQTNAIQVLTGAVLTDVKQYGNTGDLPVMDQSYARKSAVTTINNTNTVAAVSGFSLPLAASSVYQLDAIIEYTSPTAAGVRLHWAIPTGASILWTVDGPGATTAMITGVTNAAMTGTDGATSIIARVRGTVTVGTTAGTIQLEAAQNVATASDTTITARSTMELRRVA
jgi:endoglucanase